MVDLCQLSEQMDAVGEAGRALCRLFEEIACLGEDILDEAAAPPSIDRRPYILNGCDDTERALRLFGEAVRRAKSLLAQDGDGG